ncbi:MULTISPECIES: efflux RND transporter periplasmic adaptor subunit [Colwellia]|uniref:MexH family multidrug efflux RND transporter periplasmic adaptor subunit n=1 Tax=Colwellia marinimaniae TaxID=1513592 RepID=A0ABQ0MWW5_9GAMM|nr:MULTISPECIES: efflux RND transporter periplasmic adaptor subunit [Colwellia]GAW96864.1 MexH family multidrug efflux RND transporter periplasmic adaptor subunit [Colwellia marinimaniae]
MNLTKWLVVIILLAGTIFGLYSYKSSLQQAAKAHAASMPEPAATVTAVTVSNISYQQHIQISGEVQAFKFLLLINELAGEITQLNASSGSVVKEGQVLLVLDHRDEDARLMAAQATLTLQQQTLARNIELQKNRGISEERVDQARAAVQIAQADIAVITTAIDKKTLTAPFTAKVGIHNLEVGQYLDKNSQVLDLIGINDFTWIDFHLPQRYQELSLGSMVKISPMNQDADFTAKIIAIDPQLSRISRHLKYRAQLPSATLALKPNTLVSVIVPIAKQAILASVPDLAIKRDALGDYVFVLEAAGKGSYRAKQVAVKLGQRQGERVMILSGVTAGQLVANKGAFKLYPGMKVYLARESAHEAADETAKVAAKAPALDASTQ